MTPLSPKEIEQRLASPPTPPPPELLEALKAEIPEPVADSPVEGQNSPWNGRRWAIAASLLIAVGGGLLGYRTMRQMPLDASIESAAAPERAPDPIRQETLPTITPAPRAEAEPASEERDIGLESRRQRWVRAPAGARAQGSQQLPPGRDDVQLEARSVAPDSPPISATLREIPKPQAAPEEQVITVTSESPLLGARRVAPSPHAPPPRAKQASPPLARDPQSPGALRYVDSVANAVPSTGGTAEPNDQPYGDVFYRDYGVNPFIDTEDDRLSTFGLDVDTGSYSIARRYLSDGNLPPREAIRIEEFVNYFDYGDEPPKKGDFSLHAELAPTPFGSGERYHVLRFGIRGRTIAAENRKPASLIFVVDVSGSMGRENRLGLVRQSLLRLVDQLRSDDRVGLVVYGDRAHTLLEPTGDLQKIRDAIQRLQPSGSTNAEQGLLMGYQLAGRHFRENTINRLILCSDGVANVGNTGPESILRFISQEARRGIELTTVGFGMGNYNDVLMEQLADNGDGSYAYVDDLAEADRIFVENLTGTLQTIAADAKVQVDFNPAVVSRYRLIGYENRAVADERFRDDSVDAGEIGAGHSVTALYEVKLHQERPRSKPLATLHLRYRSKRSGEIEEIERAVREREGARSFAKAPGSLRLAAAVAEFGEMLKGSYWAESASYARLLEVAQQAAADFGGDADVAEFVGLVAKAAKTAGTRESID